MERSKMKGNFTKELKQYIKSLDNADLSSSNNSRFAVGEIAINKCITEDDVRLIYKFYEKYNKTSSNKPADPDPVELVRSNFRYPPSKKRLITLIKSKFIADSLGFECLCYYPRTDRSSYFLIALEEYEFRHKIYQNPKLVKQYNSARVRIEWNQIMSIYWNLVSGVNINLLPGEKLKVLNGGVWRNLKEEKVISRIYMKI